MHVRVRVGINDALLSGHYGDAEIELDAEKLAGMTPEQRDTLSAFPWRIREHPAMNPYAPPGFWTTRNHTLPALLAALDEEHERNLAQHEIDLAWMGSLSQAERDACCSEVQQMLDAGVSPLRLRGVFYRARGRVVNYSVTGV